MPTDEDSDLHPTLGPRSKSGEFPAASDAATQAVIIELLRSTMKEVRQIRSENAEMKSQISEIGVRLARGDAKLEGAEKNDAETAELIKIVVELKTKLGVLWAVAGAAGVSSIAALVAAAAALLSGHPSAPTHP